MRFAEPNLEVVLRVLPNGDVPVTGNSREAVRALGVVQLAGRQLMQRMTAQQIAQAQALLPAPAGFEIELTLKPPPTGDLILRSTQRDYRHVLAGLRTAAERLLDSIHHRRFARQTLLLAGNHQRTYERV